MTYFDQEPFDIRFEWGMAGLEHINRSDAIVIVDVLSFTTCVEIAVSRGAMVYPYRWKNESASAFAIKHRAELAHPRNHHDGKYSLAPSSLVQIPDGLRLVLPSPNGSTIAFAAAPKAAHVAAGCLRNATAVAQWAQNTGKTVTVIAAGERWADESLRPAVEDLVGAGAIISAMTGRCSPEAESAAAVFAAMAAQLHEQLAACASGRELLERGFATDVELAAEWNVSRATPVLDGDAFICPA